MIQSLDRAIKILDILAERSPETVSPSALAQRLGLSPQTVGNILRALYAQGMVSQDGSRRYRLGSHCFYLGQVADHWQTLREQSRPILKELRDATSVAGAKGHAFHSARCRIQPSRFYTLSFLTV